MDPHEKPHEAARPPIDPDHHFPPPATHPPVEMTPEIHEAIDRVIAHYAPVELNVPLLLRLPGEIRWYTYQFLPAGDLAQLIDLHDVFRDEIASYSRSLNPHCTYTVEGARQLTADEDHPIKPGDRLEPEDMAFETLLLLDNGYAVRSLDNHFAESVANTCEYVDDATLECLIRLCLEGDELGDAEVTDALSWELLMNYALTLMRERRLASNDPGIPVPDHPDQVLRLLATGTLRRIQLPQ